MTIYKLRDIKNSPFRDAARFPLRPAKIAALCASYDATGFWDNVVGRALDDGTAELAYGHHRIAAAIGKYGEDHEIDLIVRDLDDVTMLKMMALENMEEYATDFSVAMETVRAVVIAHAVGKITLPRVHARTPLDRRRYAPLFKLNQRPSHTDQGLNSNGQLLSYDDPPDRGDHQSQTIDVPSQAIGIRPYTIGTIERFLGWPGHTVEYAVRALELIELDLATEDQFIGLKLERVKNVVDEAFRTRARRLEEAEAAERAAAIAAERGTTAADGTNASEQLAAAAEGFRQEATDTSREVIGALTEGIREGTIAPGQEGDVARQITNPPQPAPAPDLNDWSRKLVKYIMTIKDNVTERFETLLPYEEHLSSAHRENLVFALDKLLTQAADYKAKLQDADSAAEPIPATGPVRSIAHG